MIQVSQLHFSYKKQTVLSGIDIEFRPGTVYGLLGENGVGKTTLLKIICGLLPCKKGSCKIDGEESFKRLPSVLSNIAYLPDTPAIADAVTPQEYIDQLAPFYPNYAPSAFLHLMQELDVEPDRKFAAMSFGQKKKSLIATTLSLGTEYILFDEPTNGLDIPSKSQFRKILANAVQPNTTIIIATHQVKDMENLLDPVVILDKQEVLLNASIEQIGQKLAFDFSSAADPDALFTETYPNGFLNVLPNIDHHDSAVNIEALFNTVLHNRQLIKQMFGQQ